jgi:hypothetical protein
MSLKMEKLQLSPECAKIVKRIKNERQLRATTGLSSKQFSTLVPVFNQYLEKAKLEKYKNKDRKIGSGKKGDIETADEKLLLMLFYLKCYSTFDVLGFTFGISGDGAHRYIYDLFPILMQTLNYFGVLPHTEFKTPEELRAAFVNIETLLIDATERAVQRLQDYELQKENQSGKKKQQTNKCTIISTLNTYILYVGCIFKGKNHDYGMFKKEFETGLDWFKTFNVYVDLGYLGFANDYKTKALFIPYKKPRKSKNNPNPTLTEEQRKYNKNVSSIRVKVEHAIGKMKRYKCFSDKYRNKIDDTKSFFKILSAGLWNFNLSC